jgi:hypothetical protein
VKGGSGLNSLLRCHFLSAALKAGVKSLLGMVYEGAPRTHLMETIGYQFSRPEHVWDEEVQPLTSVLVATLWNDHFNHAVGKLGATLGDLPDCFPVSSIDLCDLSTIMSINTNRGTYARL